MSDRYCYCGYYERDYSKYYKSTKSQVSQAVLGDSPFKQGILSQAFSTTTRNAMESASGRTIDWHSASGRMLLESARRNRNI
jgi:hypothetical protein